MGQDIRQVLLELEWRQRCWTTAHDTRATRGRGHWLRRVSAEGGLSVDVITQTPVLCLLSPSLSSSPQGLEARRPRAVLSTVHKNGRALYSSSRVELQTPVASVESSAPSRGNYKHYSCANCEVYVS